MTRVALELLAAGLEVVARELIIYAPRTREAALIPAGTRGRVLYVTREAAFTLFAGEGRTVPIATDPETLRTTLEIEQH